MNDLINQDIKNRFAQGDISAFEVIYNAYYSLAVNYATKLLPYLCVEDCKDAVQTSFMKIYQSKFNPEKAFNPYFFKILRNELYKILNKQKNIKKLESDLKDNYNVVQIDFGAKGRIKKIEMALNSLAQSQRECIILRFLSGLRISEIALITENPENTVKTRIFYGLRKMRAEFLKEEI